MKLLQALLLLPLFVLGACGGGGSSAGDVAPQLQEIRLTKVLPQRTINNELHSCAEAWVFNFNSGSYALVEMCFDADPTYNNVIAKGFAEVGSFTDYDSYTRVNVDRTSCGSNITLTRSVDRNLSFYGSSNNTTIIEDGSHKSGYVLEAIHASLVGIDWGCFTEGNGGFTYNATVDAELLRDYGI